MVKLFNNPRTLNERSNRLQNASRAALLELTLLIGGLIDEPAVEW